MWTLLLSAGMAFAAPPEKSPPAAKANAKPAGKAAGKDALARPSPKTNGMFGSEDTVPDDNKPGEAEKGVLRMKETLKRLLVVAEEARQGKDVVKLNCVNEKVTQVKGLLRIAEQSETQMNDALTRRDREVVQFAFQKVSRAAQRTDLLKADAEACVGALAQYNGDTMVTVEYSGKDLSDPTRADVLRETPAPIVRPLQVSPYQ